MAMAFGDCLFRHCHFFIWPKPHKISADASDVTHTGKHGWGKKAGAYSSDSTIVTATAKKGDINVYINA